MKQRNRINIIAEQMRTSKHFNLRNIKLSEFDKNCRIEGVKALIFEDEWKCGVIFESEFLNMTGMDIRYSIGEIEMVQQYLTHAWTVGHKH